MVKKSQIKATTKYNQKKYDDILIRVPKGRKAEYQEAAIKQGYNSLNKFATDALDEKAEGAQKDI